MNKRILAMTALTASALVTIAACNGPKTSVDEKETPTESKETPTESFEYIVDRFADIQILRYKVPGFESLSLRQKRLLYHLSEAAIMGRDILYDQNCSYSLAIRSIIETVYKLYDGPTDDPEYIALEIYLKRIWFSNGIHHHYGQEKFIPGFSPAFLKKCLDNSLVGRDYYADAINEVVKTYFPVIFDPAVCPKRTVQTGDQDLILASANNYYAGGITQKEVEDFYDLMKDPSDPTPPSYGLNSRLVKGWDGVIREQTWKVGGLYTQAIERIVEELEAAIPFAENEAQEKVIRTLVEYYRTGDLRTFDQYAILWLKDTESETDFVNGFTETYGDPLGIKGSWEATVNFINKEATKRTEIISSNAQWFEDNSPVDPRFKKKEVKGITAKVITVTMLGGDCYPATPIGINLPNADWIRRDHGSKSVTIENITQAYDQASQGSGFDQEFVSSDEEREMIKKYGFLTDNLHTDLHECLGHGSGQLLPGISPDTLKAYGSTLEEARADLFGLYYIADPKIIDLGILPHPDAYKAEYYRFLMNGLLTQLVRIEPGKDIEEAHMRNRQLIARWVYEKGQENSPIPAVEIKRKDNKSYVIINDYPRLRTLFGDLLTEVQRIKSEGDYPAGKALVERYGVKVDPTLHAEILERYQKLNLSPYKGFVNPIMGEVRNDRGEVIDITLDYTEGYAAQMLRYGYLYSFFPAGNFFGD